MVQDLFFSCSLLFTPRLFEQDDRSSSLIAEDSTFSVGLSVLASINSIKLLSLFTETTFSPFGDFFFSSVLLIFQLASGTMSFSDFYWIVGFHPFVLRPTGFFFRNPADLLG